MTVIYAQSFEWTDNELTSCQSDVLHITQTHAHQITTVVNAIYLLLCVCLSLLSSWHIITEQKEIKTKLNTSPT